MATSQPVADRQVQLEYQLAINNPSAIKEWDAVRLNSLGNYCLNTDGLEVTKVQALVSAFPFDKTGVERDLITRFFTKYPAAASPKSSPRKLGQRSKSLGSVQGEHRDHINNQAKRTSLLRQQPVTVEGFTPGALKTRFDNILAEVSEFADDEGADTLFALAKWALNYNHLKVKALGGKDPYPGEDFETKLQAFWDKFPNDRLTQEQQNELALLKRKRNGGYSSEEFAEDFPEIQPFKETKQAAEFAKRHFSDVIDDPTFAGKQRVLIQLTTAGIHEGGGEERFALIHEVMLQLREVQRKHYEKGYLGKRITKVVTPNGEEDLVKLFEGGALGLRLHRTLGRSLHGVDWNGEACSLFTNDEIKALIEKKPAKELYQRLIYFVIDRKDRTLRGEIDWTQARRDQKSLAKTALFDGDWVQTSVYYPLVVGMSSAEVIEVFGKGEQSVELHMHLGLNLEEVEWGDRAYFVLEGTVYVTFLQKRYKAWRGFRDAIKYEMRKKSPDTLAKVFVAYHGDVPKSEMGHDYKWGENQALTLEMKIKCAKHYTRSYQLPEALHAALKDPSLTSTVIRASFGLGEMSAALHCLNELPIDDLEWDETAGPALSGKVLCSWLNRHPESKELPRFLNDHGDLIPELNEARKKEAIAWFIENNQKAPDCLRPYTTRAQHHQLFGRTFGDMVALFLVGLLSLLGLHQLYTRWKKR